MFWNVIDEQRNELLKELIKRVDINQYYMAGGTALAIQLGLRESVDFDFFVPTMFNNSVLINELKQLGELEVTQNAKGTCDTIINGVQVSFFYFPNKLIDELVSCSEIQNLKLASIIDIAAMKLVAIGGRGAKKDFFDLYGIFQKCNISTDELVQALITKYGKDVNYSNIIMGLTYFEDAEQELLPKTFIEYDWEEIKKFFEEIQQEFFRSFEKLSI